VLRGVPAVPLTAGTGVTGNGRPSLMPAGSHSVGDVNPSSEVRESPARPPTAQALGLPGQLGRDPAA
jgi:hypothetical protein